MQCVILAGGLGTRMWPEAKSIPKTLLDVAGRPFASWQLDWLAAAGITDVVYSLGHLSEQVIEFVGDGSDRGLRVTYVCETDRLMGTAGALRMALDAGALQEDFLVLYGDSWLQIDPAAVLRSARGREEAALMTVFENAGRWDGSNVVLGDSASGAPLVARYEKGLAPPPPQMRWIDYGLLAFRRDVIADRVPPAEPADLAPLCTSLAAEGQLAAYLATQRFYEIGSPAGRNELAAVLAAASGP